MSTPASVSQARPVAIPVSETLPWLIGAALFGLLLYYFVDVGKIGPLPNMYEHTMYTEKVVTLIAQTVATGTALALVFLGWPRHEPAARSTTDASQNTR